MWTGDTVSVAIDGVEVGVGNEGGFAFHGVVFSIVRTVRFLIGRVMQQEISSALLVHGAPWGLLRHVPG